MHYAFGGSYRVSSDILRFCTCYNHEFYLLYCSIDTTMSNSLWIPCSFLVFYCMHNPFGNWYSIFSEILLLCVDISATWGDKETGGFHLLYRTIHKVTTSVQFDLVETAAHVAYPMITPTSVTRIAFLWRSSCCAWISQRWHRNGRFSFTLAHHQHPTIILTSSSLKVRLTVWSEFLESSDT